MLVFLNFPSVLMRAQFTIQALSNASTGSVAVLLSGVTILSWLTRPDAEQIALDSALLHALAKLTAIANRSVLSAEHDDKSSELSRRENISSQISMLEDLASLSSSIGKCLSCGPALIALC